MVQFSRLALAASTLLTATSAHPGHNVQDEALERRAALANFSKRSLSHCAEKLKARGHEARAVARREAWAKEIRKRNELEAKPMLTARDLAALLETDHELNLTGVTPDVDSSIIFTNNASCVLQPETTQGPYYVAGEHIRNDVRDGEPGVTLYTDVQVLDIDTCEPVPSMYMDWWHCNATGVYGGVVAAGNGDENDESNIDTTFLRGIQETDEDGVLQVTSIFPGHYTGRTTHVHVLAHSSNHTVNENGTLSGTSALHVGQFFFDQDLINAVEATAPYNTNTQVLLPNSQDFILWEEAATSDPFMEYVLLGDDVSDGIMAWIAVGVNMTAAAAYDVGAAVTLTEDGGVPNPDSPFSGEGMGGVPPPIPNFPAGPPPVNAN